LSLASATSERPSPKEPGHEEDDRPDQSARDTRLQGEARDGRDGRDPRAFTIGVAVEPEVESVEAERDPIEIYGVQNKVLLHKIHRHCLSK
jgi:hypothetical protein